MIDTENHHLTAIRVVIGYSGPLAIDSGGLR